MTSSDPSPTPSREAETSSPSRRLGWVRVTIAVFAVLLVVAVVSVRLHAYQRVVFWVNRAIYDNVPTLISCDEAPTGPKVDEVLSDDNPFEALGEDVHSAGARSMEACPERAYLEITYGSTTTRAEIERFLSEHGEWSDRVGWSWQSLPVLLRNI